MVRYRESLTPSLPFHLALALLIPMGYGMLAPINVAWGVVSAAVFYATALLVFVVGAPRIVITDTELKVGRAHIEREFVGVVRTISKDERSAALADARGWSLVRGWIPTGVSITITDANDPTPTWYVSTRNPEKFAAALRA